MSKKIHRFDSWSEFMENAIHGNPNISLRPGDCFSRNDEWGDSKPWSGANSFDEALEYLKKGWDDGIQRLKQFQKGIPQDLFDCIMPVKDYKPEMRHMIAGGGLDVAAHLTGATPETFIGEVVPHDEGGQVTKGRKLQTVYFNISNSSIMSEAAFFYRGAYTFTMIEHLENCGYSVELWTLNYVRGEDTTQLSYVKTKEFGELFDANKLAISLCSAFMLRRFMFAIQEQGDDEEIANIQQAAYGTPVGYDDQGNKVEEVSLPEDMDLNPIYVSTVNVEDPKIMLEKFKEILNGHVNGQPREEKE